MPIATKARQSNENKNAPTLPVDFLLKNEKSRVLKAIASIPPIINPELKSIAVGFGMMPRSLSALSIQLKPSAYVIDKSMQLNATTGASIPQIPGIFNPNRLSGFNIDRTPCPM